MTWMRAVLVDGVGRSLIGMHLRDNARRELRGLQHKGYVIKESRDIGKVRWGHKRF